MCDFKKECTAYEAETCDKVNLATVTCFEKPLMVQKAPVLNFLCSDRLCNISLKKGEDGHWLNVKASDGKQASICIENMNYGSIVKQALVQWAKDQFADVA